MADNAKQEAAREARRVAHFEGDYLPSPNVPVDLRPINALEYMAFQLGRIRASLDEINEREKKRDERELVRRHNQTQKDLEAETRTKGQR